MSKTIDRVIGETSKAIDFVGDKAGDVITKTAAYAKTAGIEVKIREKYYRLGKLCYSMHHENTDETGAMKDLIKEIDDLCAELEQADKESGKKKTCEVCGAKNNSTDTFCTKCGSKME